jgi:RimJ/RimL family protein N-acetyltransferase
MPDMATIGEPSLRPDYPITGARVLLRPLTPDDADALLAYRSRHDVSRYVPFSAMTRDQVDDKIANSWARTELTDEGQALTLGIEVAATSTLVGDIMLFWRSRRDATGELGYVLNPEFGRQGYATEAAQIVLRLGFDGLTLHRITARVDERNGASARLARRIGMRQEARLVQNEWFKDEWTTELDFAILADEWHALARQGGSGPI